MGDFSDAFNRLKEALEGLLNELHNLEKERNTMGGDASANSAGLNAKAASENLRQSVEILRGFRESWNAMENPEQNMVVPQGFHALFRPLDESRSPAAPDGKKFVGNVDES